MSIRIDEEFKSLIPPLSDEEYRQLEENCVNEGIRDPLVVWETKDGDDILIDGHNRWEISVKHAGIRFEVRKYNFNTREEVKEWIIKNQLGRRNIPNFVRAELALKLKPVLVEKAKENERLGGKGSQKSVDLKHDTQKELAKAAGVSHDTIHKVEKIKEKAEPETIEALRKGDISINKAYSDVMAKEHPTKSPKKIMKEIKQQARDEHEAFQSSKVVSFEDIERDKENLELINNDTYIKILKGAKAASDLCFLKMDDIEALAKSLTKEDRRALIDALMLAYKTLTDIMADLEE